MLSLDYPAISTKQETDYYIPEAPENGHYYDNSTEQQLAYWPITNEFNDAIPFWTNGHLYPLLSHQYPTSFEDPSIGTASDASSSAARSPCHITLSPSTTFSSITSPSDQTSAHPIISNSASTTPPVALTTASDDGILTTTPLSSLQQWTREALIDRVMALEQELVYCRSSESPKQDGWQCRWEACDIVTSTLEQLTDHLYRVHVGRGKASYYCAWTGCGRHDKPFTKRHKALNHLRTHTGERPFVCRTPGCHKRFSRPDSLSTHQKTHSNIRPFVCADCGKSYFHARSLRKHLKASQHSSLTTSQ